MSTEVEGALVRIARGAMKYFWGVTLVFVAGWVAHAAGYLPAVLVHPGLIAVRVAACITLVSEVVIVASQALGAGSLRWTRLAGGAVLAGLAAVKVGEFLEMWTGVPSWFDVFFAGAIATVGVAVLADAVEGVQRGGIERRTAVEMIAGGLGAVTFCSSQVQAMATTGAAFFAVVVAGLGAAVYAPVGKWLVPAAVALGSIALVEWMRVSRAERARAAFLARFRGEA